MTPYETIRLTAGGLSEGESARGTCPWCHGGRTREQSFAVSRLGGQARYICHRASCTGPSRGVLSISGDPSRLHPVAPKHKPKSLIAETFPLSEEVLASLYSRFQLTPPVANYYGLTQTEEGDVIIPIFNARGVQQGHERKVKVPTRAKSIRYNGNESDGMGWFNTSPEYTLPEELVQRTSMGKYIDDAIILVEDMYSAMKANYFMHSLALMGTYLSPEQAVSIAGEKYRKVYIALDADAAAKSVQMLRRYAAVLPGLGVIRLGKDIKDMSYDEVNQLLKGR